MWGQRSRSASDLCDPVSVKVVWIFATIKQISRKFREFMLRKLKHAFGLRYSNNYFNDTISNVKHGYFPFLNVPANSVRWVLLHSSRLLNWISTGIKNIKATSQTLAGSAAAPYNNPFLAFIWLWAAQYVCIFCQQRHNRACVQMREKHHLYFSVCDYRLQHSLI